MRVILSNIINFLSDRQFGGRLNLTVLVITLIALLIALWICIVISRKNKLYINYKEDKKDNAYT